MIVTVIVINRSIKYVASTKYIISSLSLTVSTGCNGSGAGHRFDQNFFDYRERHRML